MLTPLLLLQEIVSNPPVPEFKSNLKAQINIFYKPVPPKHLQMKTVAANSTGDYFEKTCANLTEAINVTGNCNMVGKKINGVIKYNRITLIMVDPLVETIPSVEINPSVITKVETTVKTTMETTVDTNNLLNMETLIAILASCGALALFLIACAVYCSYHRSSYRKNQQHLTEELQTVENGYHDNPTLEVMEVQPEMQEKKMALNGEFNDSWIVPFDNLTKDDIPEEEDTHL
ncbi:podocalyxin [Tachysurus ichikawai]